MDLRDNEPDPIAGEDKFLAAITAFFLLIMGLVFVVLALGFVTVLWSAGIFGALAICGTIAGLFAIGRAIYHALLEKKIGF